MDNGISHRSQTDARGPALARDRGALEEIAGGSSTHPPAGRIEAQTLTSHHHSRALRAAADNQARVNGPLVALFRQTAAKRKYHECVVSHVRCHNLYKHLPMLTSCLIIRHHVMHVEKRMSNA